MFARIEEGRDSYRNIVPEGMRNRLCSHAELAEIKSGTTQPDCEGCLHNIHMHKKNGMASARIQIREVKLFNHLFYHHCHTWAQIEEQAFVRIGIDDFGQKMLGPIEEVSLPLKNEKIGRQTIHVKARGQLIPLTSPIDGYVQEVNDALLSRPQLINDSPYEHGWLVLLRPTRLARNLKQLFYGAAALQWFDLEMFRLAAVITSEINNRVGRKSNMRLPDGNLPDFDLLDDLPACVTKRILEQYFLYCHTNDRFRG